MKKMINKVTLAGKVYEHDLAVKTVQNKESNNYGKEFIGGTLSIATDDDCLNIVTITYSYVTEFTKAGGKNNTYSALKNIIDNGKTVVIDGADNATIVKADTSLALNDFYTNRNGEDELVSAKRCEGGFLSIVSKLTPTDVRNKFECDMLIKETTYVEADPEKHIAEDFLRVKGAVFNFRNAILPVEFIVKNAGGIKYFESLEASAKEPVFTKVWGAINSQTIVDKREEESAFGEASVREYTRTVREWVITGTSKEPYDMDDEATSLTAQDVADAMGVRETYLADVKRRAEEYRANKGTSATTSNTVTAAAGGFNF